MINKTRTAIISDIHGNYPALMKVLEDARAEGVDSFIFLGDYFMDFPFSNEVVRELMGMENAYVVKGNKEEAMRHFREENPEERITDQNAGLYYVCRELTQESFDFLDGLEKEMYIRLSPKTFVYATHISPIYGKPQGGHAESKFSNSGGFHQAMLEKPFTHEEFLEEYHNFVNSDSCLPFIQNIDANVIVYGHNHVQSYAYCGDKLIINPGSCGAAMDFDNRAAYTILEETGSGYNVIERRVEYDIEALIRHTKSSVLYEKSKIFSELIFLDLRLARNHSHVLLGIAREIASAKGEEGENFGSFSDDTWNEAGDRFLLQICEILFSEKQK